MHKLEIVMIILAAIIALFIVVFIAVAIILISEGVRHNFTLVEDARHHEIPAWIFIENNRTGSLRLRTITLTLCRADSIEHVKLTIQAKEGIPTDKQTLVISGQVLEDGKTLKDYYFDTRSIISVSTERQYILINSNNNKK